MKPTIALRTILLGSSLLANASTLFAQETWDGSDSTNFATGANWADNSAPASGGTTTSRINVNNGAANALYYTSTQGTTIFNPTDRALVIGSTTNGSMFITGGTFDSQGSTADILGHQGGAGSLTIDGGNYINTNGGSSVFHMGLAGASTISNLTLSSGNFTTGTLQFGQDADFAAVPALVATVQLNGGILTASTISTNTAVADARISSTINFNGGTLRASSTNANFMLATSVDNAVVQSGGAIIDTNNRNITIAKALTAGTGSGGLTKQGAGALTLSAANTYVGATTVSGGNLTVSAGNINTTSGVSIGAAEFRYSSSTALTKNVSFSTTGGTLSGASTIASANVAAGNTLALGNGGVGTMNFTGILTIAGTYLYELNSTTNTADLGDVTGTLTLGGILDLVQLGTYGIGDKFTLFAYDGAITGLFTDSSLVSIADDTNFFAAGGEWKINYNDTTAGLNGGISANNTFATITAVPEPGAALLGSLGLLALLRRRR